MQPDKLIILQQLVFNEIKDPRSGFNSEDLQKLLFELVDKEKEDPGCH